MIKDLVKQNRTIRIYQKEEISYKTLEELIDITRYGACARNTQVLKYYIVNQEVLKVNEIVSFSGKKPTPTTSPSAYIVILQDQKISDNILSYQIDCGIAANNILLYATEMGYSGIMIRSFNKKELMKILSIDPARYLPLLLLGIGKGNQEVKLIDAQDGNTKYYDEDFIHYVPKRKLKDIIINKANRN